MTRQVRLLLVLFLAVCPQAFSQTERTAGYQVGAFTNESHAQALMKALGEHDFYSEIHTKVVKGVSYWVVLVPASDIPFENVRQKLLDAGYPALTLSESEWARIAPPPPKMP